MQIPVVENPRRRRRKRYTAKQRAYGFGGKRKRRVTRRRRNPVMASLAANPRRRRSSVSKRRRYYPRRRNPGFMGMGSGLIMNAAMVGIGALGSEMVPRLVRRYLFVMHVTTAVNGGKQTE